MIDEIIQGLIQIPFLVVHLGSWADELSSTAPSPRAPDRGVLAGLELLISGLGGSPSSTSFNEPARQHGRPTILWVWDEVAAMVVQS